ncbi:MAG: MFS transporter, partial [Clostridiales bacterium]|nr:MFS transporter [Clostridiales bacterium]
MVAVIEQTGATKNAAGLVASFFFFAYGIGQLVNGFLCHKYNTRIVIFGSLLLAAAANVCLPICPNVEAMKWLWLVNGCVQSVLWCSLVKLQSEYLNDKDIGKSILLMSTTTAAGTFVAYGLSALFVAFVGWQPTFYVAGGLLIAAAIGWFFGVGYVKRNLPRYEAVKTELPTAESGRVTKKPIYIALAFVFLFATVNGFVKDGVTTWAPNLLKETYSLETYFSIILTLILPLISITGAYAARLAHKKLPNDMLISGLFFVSSGGVLALIMWLYTYNLASTVIMFAFVACFMSAINNIVASSVPFRLRTVGKSGMFAGVINTFCYVGSTLSSYLIGMLADGKGWSVVILLLLVLSAAAGVISLLFSAYWKKRI